MRFRHYDALRVFDIVARHMSFTAAGERLNLTKGAVSYQIARLETALGFRVFERRHRGIALTERGRRLWHLSQALFAELEREIDRLREEACDRITVGTSTYFASRWLSPRLMSFTESHPGTTLRLQPVVNMSDLRAEGLDLAVRWGKGDWTDLESEPLFPCPAVATAGRAIAARNEAEGLPSVWPGLTLLHDRDGSGAWADWHAAAGLPYREGQRGLVVPDPNVRVQAIVNGQGVALNDALCAAEFEAGLLRPVSDIALADYGYHLVYERGALAVPALADFRDWIRREAGNAGG